MLAADAIVISDTGFFEGNVPALTTSLRGMVYTQIDVTGGPIDLHSGSFGGAVQNPANALARIITELKDSAGRVRVPGFYDDVVAPTREERFEISCLPFDEARLPQGRPASRSSSPASRASRSSSAWASARPSTSTGSGAASPGEGSKTIIPAHAHAKVSCRLVPDQDGEKLFEAIRDYVEQVAPRGVNVEVQNLGTAQALGWTPSCRSRRPLPGPSRRRSGRRRSSSARGGASRSRRCSTTSSGCRSRCSDSHEP